jgi:hypothetical protein
LYHHQESQEELRHQSPLETSPSIHRDPAVNDVFVLPADSLSLLVIIIIRTSLCSSLGITSIIIIIGLSNYCCWEHN